MTSADVRRVIGALLQTGWMLPRHVDEATRDVCANLAITPPANRHPIEVAADDLLAAKDNSAAIDAMVRYNAHKEAVQKEINRGRHLGVDTESLQRMLDEQSIRVKEGLRIRIGQMWSQQ